MRRSPIKPVNRARRAKRKAETFSLQAELCRTLSCAACGRPGPSDPAHVVSRGAGGKDRGNVIPLCKSDPATGHEGCHHAQHQRGWGAVYWIGWLVPPFRGLDALRLDMAAQSAMRSSVALAWAHGLARGLELHAYGSWEAP